MENAKALHTITGFLWAHPIWSVLVFFTSIWAIGKTHDKLTTPGYEETDKILSNTLLIMEGKIPQPETSLLKVIFLDIPLGLLLLPLQLLLLPFAFIFRKMDAIIGHVDIEFITYIKVIPEVLRDMKRGRNFVKEAKEKEIEAQSKKEKSA